MSTLNNCHTSTNAEHLQDLNQGPLEEDARAPRGFHQDLHKIFSQGPVQDPARTS